MSYMTSENLTDQKKTKSGLCHFNREKYISNALRQECRLSNISEVKVNIVQVRFWQG